MKAVACFLLVIALVMLGFAANTWYQNAVHLRSSMEALEQLQSQMDGGQAAPKPLLTWQQAVSIEAAAGFLVLGIGMLLLRRRGGLAKQLQVSGLGLILLLAMAGPARAQAGSPKIFIDAQANFASALTAAMIKKKVPATVVEEKTGAEYVLQSADVNSKDESGAGKIARCMFLDCIGMNGYSAVSVKLIRASDSAVVWAYQVRKSVSGPVGIQSLSEAIAKHLKSDYLAKQR